MQQRAQARCFHWNAEARHVRFDTSHTFDSFAPDTMPANIRIIASMATRSLLADLVAAYEHVSTDQVNVVSVGGVDAAKRVRAGESFDVVVLAAATIDALQNEGHLVWGSRLDLVTSGVFVAVRAGGLHPDIGDELALKRAILAARSVSFSTGPSGVHLQSLFERWGITHAVKPRIVQAPPGVPVGSLIAAGTVELGFQQLSELMGLQGVDVIGPLPTGTQIITTFSAGVMAACDQPESVRAMLAFMTSSQVEDIKRRNGMPAAADAARVSDSHR